MAQQRCLHCERLVEVVPWVPDEEIGLFPQRLRAHFMRGRAFVGKPCPGSGREVQVWAVPEQRGETT